MNGLPLTGVRVADFTNHAAGPYCTLLLAQLGADVIRIESNARLDIQRRPHPLYGRFDVPNFDYLAGGKRSITLNLKTSGGHEVASSLVAVSDVVVENFRPGVMDRLGLGWSEVQQLNPRAVMVSLSAYGGKGPEGRRPGYAPIFAAEGGLGYMTGYPDGAPCEIRNAMDHQAGMTAAFSVLALLEARDIDGHGGFADVAAREVASMMVGESICEAIAQGEPHRIGCGHELWSPHGVYPAIGEDRWVAITVTSEEAWMELVQAMGEPDWSADARFATMAGRCEHRAELDERIAAWSAAQPAEDLVQRLQSRGVAADLSMTAEDILADDHLRERGAVTSLQHPEHGVRETVGVPWRFDGAPVSYDRWSPELGEHNEEVIIELLGCSREQYEIMVGQGAVN